MDMILDVLALIFSVLAEVFIGAWKLIKFFTYLFWRMLKDIAAGVYGKFIQWVSAAIFISLIGYVANLVFGK